MSAVTYLVVGASRGIGRGIVEQLSQNPSNHVFASTRKPIEFGKPNVENVILEQTDSQSIDAAALKISALDVLVVNAAIGDRELLLSTATERLQQYLDTNVVGVHRVVNAFIPALRAGKAKKIMIISSTSGSITVQKNLDIGFQGPYSVTKAANNMQVMQYHNELHKDGFTVVAVSPGWVATDMGNAVAAHGDLKPFPVEKSARYVIDRIEEMKHEKSGSFLNYNGDGLPW